MYIRLPLEGTKNSRDIGGYPTTDGVVSFKQLYRSDNLKHLTLKDQQTLLDLNIKTVIDLRHEAEINNDPSQLPDAIHVFKRSLISDIHEATSEVFYKNVKLNDLYLKLLKESRPLIKDVLIEILTADHPVLFHCTAGKDRTGLITMLILGILGVEDQDIIANYEVSETYLNNRFDLYDMKDDSSKVLIESNASYMEKTLIVFYQTYQSFEHYFDILEIDKETINKFKNKMIIQKELKR